MNAISPALVSRLVTLGAFILGAGLLGLCGQAVLAPEAAAQGYGVPAVNGAEPWVMAAGVRDGAVGVAVFLVLLRQRSAMRWVAAGALLIPLGDVVISLSQGAGLVGAAPHIVGVVGISALLGLSVLEQRGPSQ